MEEKTIKEQYNEKAAALKEKYHDAINAIATKHGVDVGVGFDMLRASARGGNYAEGIDVNMEELKKDCDELLTLAEEVCKAEGLL